MDYNDLIRTAEKVTADTQWFNGSSDSIFTRLDQLQQILDGMRMAASSPNIGEYELEKYASMITELDEEKSQLEKIAGTYVDFDVEDYLDSLPGGSIAREYKLSSAGTNDLGEDDGSFLYRTASAVEQELQEADWINFVTAGAEIWVEDQNSSLVNNELAAREAAVFYVEQKTLPILDVTKRATIIDNFVTNVEICRRAKKEHLDVKRSSLENRTRMASRIVESSIDDSFGDDLNWL